MMQIDIQMPPDEFEKLKTGRRDYVVLHNYYNAQEGDEIIIWEIDLIKYRIGDIIGDTVERLWGRTGKSITRKIRKIKRGKPYYGELSDIYYLECMNDNEEKDE